MFTGNSSDTTCGYQAAISPDSGLVRISRAKHVLSNGQEIYDLSGNLVEFVDRDEQALGFTSLSGCTNNVNSSILYQSLFDDHSDCMDNDSYRPKSSYPSSQDSSLIGYGLFRRSTGGVIRRGGNWADYP